VLLQALGAGLLAALVAIGATVAIERWGGVVGGIVGTLPSTIVPAAIGIHLAAEDVQGFQDALRVTPVAMLLNTLFLWLWRVLPPRLPSWGLHAQLAVVLALALAAWCAGAATTVVALDRITLDALPVGVAATCAALLVGVVACLPGVPAPRGSRRVGIGVLVARGLLAASAIAAAVILAGMGGPLVAGMAACFPAIFTTTMVSLWLSQGQAVPAGAVGPMMLGGTSVSAFALLASFWIPSFGPAAGALLAWIVAAGALSVPAGLWLRSRASASP